MEREQNRLANTRNRAVYDLLSLLDRKSQFTLINYGYMGENNPFLPDVSESERNRLQLYMHVASGVPISGKDVLEIGSGRGRGAHFIASEMKPNSMEAVDIIPKDVEYSQKHFEAQALRYSVGNAQELVFDDEIFDVAINIESSHWYGDTFKFFQEARRVLKNEGHLLFADFRDREDLPTTEKEISDAGFKVVKSEDITSNVIASLDSDNDYKKSLIEKVPRPVRKRVAAFAGLKGSTMYEAFTSGRRVYMNYILQKAV